jgi:hypothetical protein
MSDDDTDADDSAFFSEEPRSRHRERWVVIRCALLSRPLRSASVSDAGTRRRCSVTFSAVPAARAAAKPLSPRPVRVLVGVLAARGTTFGARSAPFVARDGQSRAFPETRPPSALPSRHGADPVSAFFSERIRQVPLVRLQLRRRVQVRRRV